MKSIVSVCGICLLFLMGCATVQQVLSELQTPTASIAGVQISRLSLDTVGLDFQLEVHNPYGVELPLLDLDYALSSAGRSFFSGSAKPGGSVTAHGSRVIVLPVDIVPADLLRTLSSVRLGSVVPYRAELALGVDPPGVAPLKLPLSHDGQLPIPAPPKVEVADIRWDELSLNSAGGTVGLDVTNTNDFGLDLVRLDTGLSLGGHSVATLLAGRGQAWTPGATQRLELPLRISPIDLGIGFFQMLTGGGSGYALDGSMEVGTPFGSLLVPLSGEGQTTFSR